jgi:type II secretory pathway component GspD/PulD (secretin)
LVVERAGARLSFDIEDISDDRFPMCASETSNILHVAGPPRYVEDVGGRDRGDAEANRNVAIDMRVFPLRYANADDRVFTVRDLADRMPVYARLIESLDKEQPLIELKVVIIDVNSDRLVDLGVDWRLGTGGDDDGASVGVSDADVALGALRQGITFAAVTTDPLTVLARIRALESQGEARVVSRPAVLTFDNFEALLDQSESFFVRLEGERAVQLQEIVVGLLVKVTPRLIDDGTGRPPRVQMTIEIEDGTALPEEAVDQIPSVQRANLSTQGLVAERQALVIGGFYRERQLDNLDKVPILGDIPVLGWALFQRRNKQQTSVTRLFMIRPIVVRDVERRGVVAARSPATSRRRPCSARRPSSGSRPKGPWSSTRSVSARCSVAACWAAPRTPCASAGRRSGPTARPAGPAARRQPLPPLRGARGRGGSAGRGRLPPLPPRRRSTEESMVDTRLDLRPDTGELARLVDAIEAFAASNGLDPAVAGRLTLALDEIVTNAISYGGLPTTPRSRSS